ncbi:MAG: class II fructose-bisphosphate aldolase, partial [Gammaproteobacteria bacterium]|nr:class II fructose-bisphosphate aldolase [Gammaproteobacteria bacterium]
MPLVDMKDMLAHAYANGYAVGAFELADLDFLPTVLAAAESARAPVILRVAKPRSQDAVFAWAMAAVEAA